MASNDWTNAAQEASGATLSATPAAPSNDWGTAAAVATGQDIDATNGQVNSNLQTAVGTNADTEAQHRALADKTGIPVATVRADPTAAEQQVVAQQTNAVRLAQRYPHTAKFLTDLDASLLAHDDIAAMTATEGALNPGLFSLPPLSVGERISNWKNSLFDAEPGSDADKARSYVRSTANIMGMSADALKRDVFNAPSEIPQQFASGVASGATAGLIPNTAGEANTAWGQVAAGAGDLTGFLIGAPVKATEYVGGKLVSSALSSKFEVAATDSFAKALGKTIVKQASILTGANVVAGVGRDIDSPDLQTAAGDLGHDIKSGVEMGTVFGAAGRILPDTTLLQGVIRAAGVNLALDTLNGTNPLDQRSTEQKIFDYGLNTFFARHGEGRTTGGWWNDAAKADTSQADGQMLNTLLAAAAGSKLRVRDPDAFQNFVDAAATSGNVPNLYLSPEGLSQSGVTPEALAKLSPSAAEQLATSLQTGTDIRIPTAEFATKFAGTPEGEALLQHVKTDPQGFSQAEAADFTKNQGEALRAQVEQVLAEKSGDDAFTASRQVVHDDLLRQLTETNRFTGDVNKPYATLVSNLYATMAARTGMTPEAFYKAHPLNINAELPSARTRKRGVLNEPLKQFGGLRSATADQTSLGTASSRIAAGEDAEAVRKETGWARGDDGKWRYEINDQDAKLAKGFDPTIDGQPDLKLGDILAHDRLFEAYPDLANTTVHVAGQGKGRASYNPNEDAIRIGPVGEGRFQNRSEFISSLMHEIQHAIQKREGFAGGTNLKTSGNIDNYAKAAGEIEARNTQSRLNMGETGRREISPEDTRDIPRSDAIVEFKGSNPWWFDAPAHLTGANADLGFYSHAAEVATTKLPNTGTSADMLKNLEAYVRNGDIKADELEFSGVREWLGTQTGKVSKADVANFLRQGGVKLEEVTHQGNNTTTENAPITMHDFEREDFLDPDAHEGLTDAWSLSVPDGVENIEYAKLEEFEDGKAYELNLNGNVIYSGPSRQAALDTLNEATGGMAFERENDDTKYSRFTLPGGENYREVLMTLPQKLVSEAEARKILKAKPEANLSQHDIWYASTKAHPQYRSQHFDEPNVLAHFRLDDRADAEGKKVLFVEEIQSDWHQQGRRKGYDTADKKNERDAWEAKREELNDARFRAKKKFASLPTEDMSKVENMEDLPPMSAERQTAYDDWQTAEEAYRAHSEAVPLTRGAVPDAPFKKTWQDLALKRILNMATEGGYDKIAWTTGEQQAARYDLSKHVNAVYYEKNENGTYDIAAHRDGDARDQGTQVIYEEGASAERIEELIGKDVAQRIVEGKGQKPESGHRYGGEGRDWRALTGLDLKFGGEGMHGFYDEILPKAMDKLVKKWGGKTGQTSLERNAADESDYGIKELDNGQQFAHVGKNTAQFATWGEANKWVKDNLQPKVHSLDLTPEIKAGVSEGQPLFQAAAKGTFNRGLFTPSNNTMTLLKNADLSTFLHETGHFMLETLNKVSLSAAATPEIKADMDTVLKSFKIEGATPEERSANWNKLDLDAQRENHETFARSFEAYLFTGKAPSVAMRGVFQRFRAWLLNVYRNMSALNVELSDDVKGVFDRMLATNDQIKEHEALQNYAPLFEKPEDGKMSPDEYRAYHELGVQATQEAQTILESRSLKDMKWLSNAKGRELKRLQRDAETKRKSVRREVTDEVMSEPVNRATQFIKRGLLDMDTLDTNKAGRRTVEEAGLTTSKLSLDALKEMYGSGEDALWRKLQNGKYGFVAKEGGLRPDAVAELFKFGSGDELVKSLLNAENPREKINALTDWRMLERYGDLTDPRVIEQAANEAVHNEARTKFIASEMNALNKAVGNKKILAEAAKGFAEQMVARQRVRDVKPNQYSSSEARAARAAEDARKKGDLAVAATQKRNQLINNYATRAANEALEDVEKGLRYLAKFNRPGTRENIDADYLDQIDALLERFDLRRGQSLKAIDKRKSLAAWLESQAEQGLVPNIPADLVNEANRKSYKDMSIEEMRGLLDTVHQIEHVGRLKEKLLTAQDERNFGVARDNIVQTILDNAPKRNRDLRTRSNAGGELLNGANRFLALHRKMASMAREMDGFKDGGPVWDYFIRTMNTAGDKEATMRADATQRMAEMVQPLLNGERMGGKGQFFPSLGISLNREERISMALNMGNEGNIQRLLDGEGWTMERLRPVLDSLKKEDWDFAQKVWDFFESYRPEIAAKERRVYGKEPDWIQPTPVETRHGTYRGGYYPIKYDPQRSGRAQEHADAEDAKQMLRGAYTSSTTRRSFTKERADEVKGRPLLYSLAGLYNGTTEVIHDLSYHEWLIDANRLLRSKAIDTAMRTKYGAETVSLFKDAIRDIGQGDVGAQNVWEQSVNHLRTGATVAGLGWNFTTSLLQPLGLSNSMARIGTKWVASGVRQWLKSPFDVVENVYAKSEMMRLRGQTMNREIAEIRNRVSGTALERTYRLPGDKSVTVPTLTGAAAKVVGADKAVTARDWVQASMFLTIQKMQLVADVPTWLGQYEKSIAAGESDSRAVAMADQAVIDSQGGGQIKDLAGIQRGGPLQKLFTNFYSYFNVIHNLGAEVTNRTDWKDPASIAMAARDYLLIYIIPVVLGDLLKQAIGGVADDTDGLVKYIINDEISYMFGTLVGVRELAGAAQKIAGVQQFDTSYQGPAGMRFMSQLYNLSDQVSQGDWDTAARKASINTGGILFHLPSGQINKTIDGANAIMEGQAYPQALLVGPPQH